MLRRHLPAVVLHLSLAVCCAQNVSSDSGCWVKVHSLKNASPFSSLAKGEQDKVLHALSDDMLEMAELDIASSSVKRADYKAYFISHLEFKNLPEAKSDEKLLVIRYSSNTMCGSHENCPMWVVRLTHSGAQSMVPWQNEHLGTSIGGGWGVGERSISASQYPELTLLTHLSSTQTGLACFRESKGNYLRVDCAPECAHLFEHRAR